MWVVVFDRKSRGSYRFLHYRFRERQRSHFRFRFHLHTAERPFRIRAVSVHDTYDWLGIADTLVFLGTAFFYHFYPPDRADSKTNKSILSSEEA